MSLPSWFNLSQTSGTSGTTVITISAGTNSSSSFRMDSFEVRNSSNLSENVVVVQRASGDCDFSKQYMNIECLSKGNLFWCNQYIKRDFQYRRNGGNWINGYKSTQIISIPVSAGDIVEFKSTDEPTLVSGSGVGAHIYVIDSDIIYRVRGNILSLILGDNFLTTKPENYPSWYYAYYQFFNGNSGLIDASNLIFPDVSPSNYYGMFRCCTKLKFLPNLPAKKLVVDNYRNMFAECISIETTPVLPATELADGCYYGMFYGCTSLVTMDGDSILPATKVYSRSYSYMFYGCINFEVHPRINAREFSGQENCSYMFAGCSSLSSAENILVFNLTEACYMGMYHSCTNLTVAPQLIAQTNVSQCYDAMFYGCSSLNYIDCRLNNQELINYGTGLTNWVYGVASTGTFVKAPTVTWPSGVNGIPNNWTII